MTLAPDKSELAQQIADVLEERINAGPHVFYGSAYYTKSDYCKHLIKPLPVEYQIDTLLESLPTHDAKSLREIYSRFTSCFDQNGELLNQDLSLKTVVRYMNDLIKELRGIAQRSEQNTTAAKQKTVKPAPIQTNNEFTSMQVEWDDENKAYVLIKYISTEVIDSKRSREWLYKLLKTNGQIHYMRRETGKIKYKVHLGDFLVYGRKENILSKEWLENSENSNAVEGIQERYDLEFHKRQPE